MVKGKSCLSFSRITQCSGEREKERSVLCVYILYAMDRSINGPFSQRGGENKMKFTDENCLVARFLVD